MNLPNGVNIVHPVYQTPDDTPWSDRNLNTRISTASLQIATLRTLRPFIGEKDNPVTRKRICQSLEKSFTDLKASGIGKDAVNYSGAKVTHFELDPEEQLHIGIDAGHGPDKMAFSVSFGSNRLTLDSVDSRRARLSYNLRLCNFPQVMVRRGSKHTLMPPGEKTALECLREMISETAFRKYLTYGFLLVNGGEGRTYQVFRGHHHTKVWQQGKVTKEICVSIKDPRVPPTDSVIALKTMIETDETALEKMANVYPMESVA